MKQEIGWGNPNPYDTRSKFHYFGLDGRSLCGKWGRFAGRPEVEDGKDDHPDNCAGCKKKIAKYRAERTVDEYGKEGRNAKRKTQPL